ncbi:MAG: galactose oxidase, partial [Actinobacteria bacterium]|nr:galactose oxidase [Actinomycetota bacterium]
MRRTVAYVAAIAVALAGGIQTVSAQPSGPGGDPSEIGAFAAPIVEPGGHWCEKAQDPAPKCKPAAVSVAVLPDGRIVYWDGLEGMNNVKYSTALEFGHTAQNDQSRVLDLSGPTPKWTVPNPEDGGAFPNGNPSPRYLAGGAVPHNNENTKNDGDLFCSSLVQLSDGTVLVAGGTTYYEEPAAP